MTDYARLRALAEAATPGSWYVDDAGDIAAPKRDSSPEWTSREWVVAGDGQCAVGDSDADYIAAIDPPTLLALLDRLEALEGREPEWEYAVRWVQTEGQPVTDIGADREDIDALVLSQDGYAEAVRRKVGDWESVTGDDDA